MFMLLHDKIRKLACNQILDINFVTLTDLWEFIKIFPIIIRRDNQTDWKTDNW